MRKVEKKILRLVKGKMHKHRRQMSLLHAMHEMILPEYHCKSRRFWA